VNGQSEVTSAKLEFASRTRARLPDDLISHSNWAFRYGPGGAAPER
jgi:hypothetical protein